MNPPQPSAVDTAEEAARRRRRLAGGVLFLGLLTSYSGVIPVFATRICEYFSLSIEQYGTTIGLGSVGQSVSLFLVGILIARFGVRRITEAAMVGIGACLVLLGWGASLRSMQYSFMISGLFSGLARVSISTFLVALYPALKRRIISFQLVSISAVGIAVFFWANQLLKWSEEGGDPAFVRLFFGPFVIVGCCVIAGSLLLSLSRNVPLKGQSDSSGTLRIRDLLEYRSLTIVLLIVLHASADGVIFQFIPLFMNHHFDHLPLAPAWALSGHAAAYVATRFLLTLLPEGYGQRTILTLAGPIGGMIILAMLWQPHAIYIPLIYTLASLFYAAEFPVLLSEISSRSTGHFGSILAAGYLASNAASFLALKGTGRLVDTTGDYRVALSVAACGFIAFGAVAAITGLGKRVNSETGAQSLSVDP